MNLYNLFESPKNTPQAETTGIMPNQDRSATSPIGSGTSRWEQKKKPVTMMGVGNNGVVAEARDVQLDEISNKILGDYKKAAGADAAAADKAGDIERGNKRFKGIVKATIKQGDNDAKKHKEQGVAEGKKPDNYHIVNKDGKPASLASYADRASAEKDRDAKHPDAQVRQVGPRGKVKGVSEAIPLDTLRSTAGSADKDNIAARLKKSMPKKSQPYNDPNWIKKLPKDQLDALGGKKYNKDKSVKESMGRATPKMPKARDPGHAVLAAKRSSGAAGQHTNKRRQAVLQPKHQKPLTRDMDLDEGWKSKLGGAALAGAMALGAGGAQAQSAGDQYQPNMVAHITYSVNGQKVTKDINLGSQYESAREAADAVTDLLKSNGIKYFYLDIERVGDDQVQKDYMATTPASPSSGSASMDARPYRAAAPDSDKDYMVKEELDESIERRLMQMRHAGYDIN